MHLEQILPHPDQGVFVKRTVDFDEVLDDGAKWLSLGHWHFEIVLRDGPMHRPQNVDIALSLLQLG